MMNRFFTLLLAASCLTAVGQLPDYVPADGLVAWYEFNSDLEDLGPNQNHGQSSSISYGEDVIGNNQSSLRLEHGEYVDLGLIDLLLNGAEDQMTMTFWSKPNDGSVITISKYQNGNSSGSSWEVFDIWSQGVRVLGNGTETGGNPAWFDVCPQTTTNWSHIAVVLDFGVATIWVNGNFICERPIPTSEVTTPQPVLIGRSNCSNGSGCNDSSGLVDKLGFWSRPLTEEEIIVLYNTTAPILGCTDTAACNFNTNAISDDGSCHFNCQFCLTGTVWSEDLGGCIGDGSGDINLDGCVELNDLLDLLSAYGNCGAEETLWQCGDPLEYQGYDYETVQIGEQCWFAENLRAKNYGNGEAIPADLSDSEWAGTTEGAVSVYDGDMANLCTYGRLYNWYAVHDDRSLCPNNWSVPLDSDWLSLEVTLGMSNVEAATTGYRGSDQGMRMKATSTWADDGNGSNLTGFNAVGAGIKFDSGNYDFQGEYCYWWVRDTIVTVGTENEMYRELFKGSSQVGRGVNAPSNYGYSIRCIKD